jgi:predicted DNA-binding ribbon-helix-helix protein
LTGTTGNKTLSARPLKRSFTIRGHRTSISLEAAFWAALKEAAEAQDQSLSALVAQIDADRGDANLSSAVRVWLLDFTRRGGLAGTRDTDSPLDQPEQTGLHDGGPRRARS